MLLSRLVSAAVLFATSCLVTSAHADTFFYNFSTQLSTLQVSGTITTDTNEGVLSYADILDFNLLLTAYGTDASGAPVVLTDTLTYATADNSTLYGYALYGDGTGLFFDYGTPNSGLLIQNSTTGTYLCLQTYGCDDSTFDAHESIGIGGQKFTEAQSDFVQIATLQAPAPEPSSLILLGTGSAAMLGMVRRRFRRV